jgi:hypothetical protein
MNYGRRKLGRIAFSAAVAVALGFGATEAFAGPAEPTRAGPYCDLAACDSYCRSIGAENGFCSATRGCLCLH